MFRIIRDPSSGGHLHIVIKVLKVHGASPYSRHGGCIGEPIVCTVCIYAGHEYCFVFNAHLRFVICGSRVVFSLALTCTMKGGWNKTHLHSPFAICGFVLPGVAPRIEVHHNDTSVDRNIKIVPQLNRTAWCSRRWREEKPLTSEYFCKTNTKTKFHSWAVHR